MTTLVKPVSVSVRVTVQEIEEEKEWFTRTMADFEREEPCIRSSSMNCLHQCHRKFMFQCRMGLRQKGRYVSALTVGQWVHQMLSAQYAGKSFDTTADDANAHYQALVDTLAAQADVNGVLPGGKPLTSVLTKAYEDLTMAQAVAFAYHNYFPIKGSDYRIVANEILLEASVVAIRKPIRGRLDLVVQDTDSKEYWIVDHKTTGIDLVNRAATMPLETQTWMYRLLADAYLRETESDYQPGKLVGFIHNMIYKTRLKYCPTTKDKGGFKSYIERVLQWYKDEMGKGNNRLMQSFERFSGPMLSAEHYLQLKEHDAWSKLPLDAASYNCSGVGNFSCMSMAGQACEYLPLCRSAISTWPSTIPAMYDVRFRDQEESEQELIPVE